MKNKIMQFLFQLICHLALIHLIFNGSRTDWLLVLLFYFLYSCVGLSMTLHRWLSHCSWNPPLLFKFLGLLLASTSVMGSPLSWVLLHREHHKHADNLLDPHSPQNQAWWVLFWKIIFSEFPTKIPKDLIKIKSLFTIHKYYNLFHILLITSVYFYPFMISVYLAPAALCWITGSLIVTLNHLNGYRNFNTADNSYNNILTGYITFGEGWHNNHHNDPGNVDFSKLWWEFDISAILIKLIKKSSA